MTRRTFLAAGSAAVLAPAVHAQRPKRNVVFILTDDHRYDYIGALGHPWLKGHTPHMDRLFTRGAHFRNAFVTSSLCSPSRATILTGQYMHAHRVADNFTPLDPSRETFPRMLQKAGYRTAFIGKWHMGGDSDEPRPGFDTWVSFRGQGEYNNPPMNFNGTRRQVNGYMTDVLTGEARRFITDNASRPFCLYLSHKAVHYPFEPPKRHEGLFEGLRPTYPQSMIFKEENYQQWPEWVRKRRYTRHGVDGMFGSTGFFDEFYRGYCQCLKSVDESVGEVLAQLEDRKLLDDTLVIYMGDNGYMWGEHGLIDKRAMLEPSIRVPMMAHCPGMFQGGRTIDAMALNLDIAPTLLDLAGLKTPASMHGASLVPLLEGKQPENWRNDFVYEYEWEQDYPYTPTITGLRTSQHSLAQFYGIWDVAELYDIRKDPEQMRNLLSPYRITSGRGRYTTLIQDAELKSLVTGMQQRLAEILKTTGGDPRLAGLGSEGDKFAL